MKKYIAMAVAVALMAGTAGCNKKEAKVSPKEQALSAQMGTGMGAQFVNQAAEQGGIQDPDQFLKGLEMAVNSQGTPFGNGYMMGQQMLGNIVRLEQEAGVTIDRKVLLDNIAQVVKAGKPLTDAQLDAIYGQLNTLIDEIQTQNSKAALDQGAAYIKQEMAGDKAYKKTASGLVYKVIEPGKGANFAQGQTVMVKYKGMHIDGTTFDESPEPVEFDVDLEQLIPGFVEALTLMRPGAKMRAILPPNIAYGELGNQGGVKPNETLVFDIETVGLK